MNALATLVEHAGGAGAVTIRWLTFAGIAGVIGAVVFRLFVIGTGARPAGAPGASARGERLAAGAGVACAVVLALSAPVRVALQARGLSFEGDPWLPMVPRVISTAWGHAVVWQFAAALVALAGFTRIGRAAGWWHAGVAGVVLAVTPALTGHAAASESARLLVIGADVAHVLAAGAWSGGLALLTMTAVAARGDPEGGATTATLIDRFHPVAQWSVGALVVSGGIATWLHLRTLADFTATPYGRVLLAKLALVGVALLLGWLHSRTAATKARNSGAGSISASLGAEWAVMFAVLAVTGLLAGSPPPGSE